MCLGEKRKGGTYGMVLSFSDLHHSNNAMLSLYLFLSVFLALSLPLSLHLLEYLLIYLLSLCLSLSLSTPYELIHFIYRLQIVERLDSSKCTHLSITAQPQYPFSSCCTAAVEVHPPFPKSQFFVAQERRSKLTLAFGVFFFFPFRGTRRQSVCLIINLSRSQKGGGGKTTDVSSHTRLSDGWSDGSFQRSLIYRAFFSDLVNRYVRFHNRFFLQIFVEK